MNKNKASSLRESSSEIDMAALDTITCKVLAYRPPPKPKRKQLRLPNASQRDGQSKSNHL